MNLSNKGLISNAGRVCAEPYRVGNVLCASCLDWDWKARTCAHTLTKTLTHAHTQTHTHTPHTHTHIHTRKEGRVGGRTRIGVKFLTVSVDLQCFYSLSEVSPQIFYYFIDSFFVFTYSVTYVEKTTVNQNYTNSAGTLGGWQVKKNKTKNTIYITTSLYTHVAYTHTSAVWAGWHHKKIPGVMGHAMNNSPCDIRLKKKKGKKSV